MITIIAALTRDNAIGKGNDLLYHISADLRRFKALTTGHTVIMGRKTYESLPSGPLPNRRNIVVSRNKDLIIPGAEVFTTIEDAVAAAANDEVFIIGGAQIYNSAIALADKLELTEILAERPDADTFFPNIDQGLWHTEFASEIETDPCSGVNYRFLTLVKS